MHNPFPSQNIIQEEVPSGRLPEDLDIHQGSWLYSHSLCNPTCSESGSRCPPLAYSGKEYINMLSPTCTIPVGIVPTGNDLQRGDPSRSECPVGEVSHLKSKVVSLYDPSVTIFLVLKKIGAADIAGVVKILEPSRWFTVIVMRHFSGLDEL